MKSILNTLFRVLASIAMYIIATHAYACGTGNDLPHDIKDIKKELVLLIYDEMGAVMDSHIVERGETWESIAARYGMELKDLKELHLQFEELYAGAELTVPTYPKWSLGHERKIISSNPKYDRARKQFDSKNWKQATKAYTDIIKTQESLTAYYMRGLSHYNNGKYKEAARDLRWVASHDKYSLYADASETAKKASAAWDKKKAQRAQMWGNLAIGVLQAGAEITGTVLQAKQASGSSSKVSSSNKASSSKSVGSLATQMEQPGYFQGVYNELAQQSIQQVYAEEQAEYQQFRQSILAAGGKDLTLDEYRLLKGQALMETNGGKSSANTGSGNTGGGHKSSSTTGTNNGRTCPICHGLKYCQTCDGHGYYRGGFGLDPLPCPNCPKENGRPSGKCSNCNGTGRVP